MKEKIDKFIEYFTTITQEESDYIQDILRWDDETKAAFMFAKRMFEEKYEVEDETVRTRKSNKNKRTGKPE